MSFYVALAGGIIILVGMVSTGTATGIVGIKGNQQENTSDKISLRVAAAFLGLSILFAILFMILLFRNLAAKGCPKSRIPMIIVTILLAISLIISLVIIRIFINKKKAAGDESSAAALNAALYLPLIALGLYAIGFTLLYIVIGRKIKRVSKVCKQVAKYKGQASQFSDAPGN